MKRIGFSCLALAVVAHPGTPAAAPPAYTGHDLARSAAVYERARHEGKFRNEQEERQVNYFVGYVEGAALASRKLCIPSQRGTREQMGEITANYLRQHPREWHLAPDTLVVKALQPAFSCSKPRR
ncbi:MAG: Rap1a/Tai family immunity protein [Burkholderiales bacterium]